MEKLGNNRIEDFPATTLFYDDLSDIVSAIKEVCARIEIRTGNYKTDNTDEIGELAKKQKNDRFMDIYIQAYDPYISIDLKTYGISAYISEDAPEQRGVVAKIKEIADRGKKRHFEKLYKIPLYALVASGTVLFIKSEYEIGAFLVALAILSIEWTVKLEMKNKVIIKTMERGSSKSFVKRKRDDITLAFIAAIFGGIVTFLVTKYLL